MSTRRQITIEPPGLPPMRLSRLHDDEVIELGRIAAPIFSPAAFRWMRRGVLPRLVVAIEALFGRCRVHALDGKFSFRAPLLVSTVYKTVSLHYVVTVTDLRGWVTFDYYRLDGALLGRSGLGYREPIEGELTQAHLRVFENHLVAYLLGYSDAALAAAAPFYRVVRSALYVYGKHEGEMFEREFSSVEELDHFVRRLRGEIDEPGRTRSELERLILAINSGRAMSATLHPEPERARLRPR